MTDKEKIRKEISRLQGLTMDKYGNFNSGYSQGEFDVLCALETFIDSLPEEPASDDLEEAASDCYYHNHAYAKESFIEGANWQKENDILIFKQVYADLLSAKGYNIGFVNSEIDRLEKELNKEG